MSSRADSRVVAGAALLALGGFAAGYALERRLVSRRWRRAEEVDEPFFTLRTAGPVVITPDGVRLHTEVELPEPENDHGPTLVFVHGFAMGSDCWHFQRRHLRGRHRMIFYDQRSHGRSSRSAPELSRIPQLAVDLAQVLQEVAGAEPVILIGHSMGAMAIMELARHHPEWFGATEAVDGVGPIVGVGLVCTASDDLVDDHPIRGLPNRAAARIVEPTLDALIRIPATVARTRTTDSDLSHLITRQLSFPSKVPPSYVGFAQALLATMPLEVIAEFLPAFAGLDLSEALPVIRRVPMAVVGARQDLVTAVRHTELMMETLTEAEQLILEPCGHLAMIEHHREVNRLLERLIERARTTSAQQ